MNEQVTSSELAEAKAAIDGDQAAMMSLWRRHRRWVAAVLLAYKPRHEDLDDLLQEVAMTVVKNLQTVRDARFVRAWLRTVAMNAARSAGRAKRPAVGFEDDGGLDQGQFRIHRNGHANDEVQRMLNLVRELPEQYREPLMLRAVRGLSSRQVGEILDLPVATVDTRVCRARRMLRDLVDYQAAAADDQAHPEIQRNEKQIRRSDDVPPLRIAASGDA